MKKKQPTIDGINLRNAFGEPPESFTQAVKSVLEHIQDESTIEMSSQEKASSDDKPACSK